MTTDTQLQGETLQPPDRIRVVVRAATGDDWIGVAYCKDYKGDPSTIHEYVRVRAPVATPEGLRDLINRFLWDKYGCTIEHHRMKVLKHFVEWAESDSVRASVAGPQSVVNLQAWTSIDAWLRENPTASAAECLAELVRRIEIETASTTQAGEVSGAPVVGQWLSEIESACNSALLDVYDQSIANAPISPEYARGTADCIAHRVGQIREAIAAIRAAAPADNDEENELWQKECNERTTADN